MPLPAPKQPMVYVVVWSGLTILELFGKMTLPIPLFIEQETDLSQFQARVDCWGGMILEGAVENVQTGSSKTTIFTPEEQLPPVLLQVN